MVEGEWQTWDVDGRRGAILKLGPVFAAQISYPHDPGLGPRWKAWLNNESLGLFRSEAEARLRVEMEITRRVRAMQPALARFQTGQRKAHLSLVG
ncbi:MAG TPA: hypothetical protein VGM17_01505 [Rhizomicrobium sp.]|jgi:hypothetical protein